MSQFNGARQLVGMHKGRVEPRPSPCDRIHGRVEQKSLEDVMDTPGDEEMKRQTKRALDLSIAARAELSKNEVTYYGKKPNTAGLLFENYANMILNRNI